MRNFYHLLSLVVVLLGISACTPKPQQEQRHERSPSRTQAADISQDGSFSLVATSEHGLLLIDLDAQQPVHNWQHEQDGVAQIVGVAISPDNKVAVAASRETIAIWDIDSGAVLGYWRLEEAAIRDIAVSNRGRHLIIARADGVVLVFEPDSGRRLEFFGHSEGVNSIDVSGNGRYVISGSDDRRALIWRTDNAQVIQQYESDGRINRVRFNPDGSSALVASSQTAVVMRLTSGEVVSELKHRTRHKSFLSAAFSKDGKWLVTGSPSRHLEVWRVEDGKRMKSIQVKGRSSEHPPRAAILATAFSTDSQHVITESSAGFGERWSVELPQPNRNEHAP